MRQEMTKEEIYNHNKKVVKYINTLTPVAFWVLIGLAILCFVLSIQNVLDNVNEITSLLDSKKYTETQVQANYEMLLAKYGEIVIGGSGGGLQFRFLNIKTVVVNGFSISTGVFSFVFLIGAFLLGKWVLPSLSKRIEQENQDMVNITILRGN